MATVAIIRGRVIGMLDAVNIACVRIAEKTDDPEASAELKRIHTILTATRRVIAEDEE